MENQDINWTINPSEELVKEKTAKMARERGLYKYTDPFWRPTQSLLQKWLREVHDIHIVITPLIDDDSPEEKTIFDHDIYSDLFEDEEETTDFYDTYEEALEKALVESLELLKPIV